MYRNLFRVFTNCFWHCGVIYLFFTERDKKNISPLLLQKEIKYNICHDNLYLTIFFFIKNLKTDFILAQIQGEKVGGGRESGHGPLPAKS